MSILVFYHIAGGERERERAGCFTLFAFNSFDHYCSVSLPHGAVD